MAKLDEQSSEVKTKKAKTIDGIIFVLLLIGAVAMVFPLLYMVLSSFMTKNQILSANFSIIPDPWKFGKYSEVLQKPEFLRGLRNTLTVAIPVLVVGAFTSSLAAFSFSKLKFKGKNGIFLGLLATMMIPTQVTMIPLFVVMNRMGLIDSYASVILPSIFRPFAVFMLVQQMRTIPNDFLDAARIDGANVFQIFRKVALPLCIPSLATLSITTFMESWNDYLWPLLMLTNKNKMTLPIALSTLNGQYATEYNVLMAGSLISMIPIILIYIVAQRQFKDGMMAGGIKG